MNGIQVPVGGRKCIVAMALPLICGFVECSPPSGTADAPTADKAASAARRAQSKDANSPPAWVGIVCDIFGIASNGSALIQNFSTKPAQGSGAPPAGEGETVQLLLPNILKDRTVRLSELEQRFGKPDSTAKDQDRTRVTYGPVLLFSKPGDDIVENMTIPVDLFMAVSRARSPQAGSQ